MKFKIGFSADKYEHEDTTPAHIAVPEDPKPVRSVVQIHFPLLLQRSVQPPSG